MKNKNNIQNYLFVEVLQNGTIVASVTKPLRKRSRITISPHNRKSITIPFYPLSTVIKLFEINTKNTKLFPEKKWHGFIKNNGKFRSVASDQAQPSEINIFPGDYGSLTWNDLNIIFKISPLKKESPRVGDVRYRGAFTNFILDSKENVNPIFGAIITTLILFTGMIIGSGYAPPTKQITRSNLTDNYLLPFINARHFETLPEALRGNFDSQNICSSTINFYTAITASLLNIENVNLSLIPTSTLKIIAKSKKEQLAEIEAYNRKILSFEENNRLNKHEALLSLPFIKGETIAGEVLRLQDKISIYHKSLEINENNKNGIKSFFIPPAKKFLDDQDSDLIVAKKGLSQINVFGEHSNEEMAHIIANMRKNQVLFIAKNLERKRVKLPSLRNDSHQPIGISKELTLIVDQPFTNFTMNNEKSLLIAASNISKERQKPIVKEPIIGSIPKYLVENTIEENKFDLQLCFELALRRKESTSGSVQLKWRLDSKGEISDISLLSTTVNDRQMERCLQRKISSWKFPKPQRGSVEISHRFIFRPLKG